MSPTNVIEKYKRLNFPFIFREVEVNESMLSDAMLKQATDNKRKFPQKCMTLKGMSDKIKTTGDPVNLSYTQ